MTRALQLPDLRRILDGLERRLGILERRIRPQAEVASAALGGDAFVTVAASDTPEELRAAADYLCDGSADQTEIQQALSFVGDAGGGMVLLLPGNFDLTAGVTVDAGTLFIGSGRDASYLTCSAAEYVITGTGASITIAHMSVEAEHAGGGPLDLVTGNDGRVLDCYLLQDSPSATVPAILLGGTGTSMTYCHVVADETGISIPSGWDYVTVADNYIEANTSIALDSCSHSLIHNNLCRGAGGASGYGILVQGADDNTITDNHITDYGVDGIRLETISAATPDRNNIQGNTFRDGGSGYGIRIMSGDRNLVANNDLYDSGSSGEFLDSGTNTRGIGGLPTGGAHPDLATHDTLGLATQAELDAHDIDTTSVHGIADTSVLATDAEVATAVSDHAALADPHTGYLKESIVSGMAAPTIALGATAAAGVATTVISSDATIDAFDTTAPNVIEPDDVAAVGVINFAARRDHEHGIVTAVAGASTFADAAAEGTATSFARSDHKHSREADPVTAHAAAADPHTGYVLESLIDAAADLIVGTAADTVGRLAKGAALDVLRVNAGATALEWAAPAAGVDIEPMVWMGGGV